MTDKVFDPELSLTRMGGDRELLATAAEAFLETAPATLQSLQAALRDGDVAAAMLQAHSMKGMASTFDAVALTAESLRQEMLARDGDISGAREAMPEFERELERFLEALETLSFA